MFFISLTHRGFISFPSWNIDIFSADLILTFIFISCIKQTFRVLSHLPGSVWTIRPFGLVQIKITGVKGASDISWTNDKKRWFWTRSNWTMVWLVCSLKPPFFLSWTNSRKLRQHEPIEEEKEEEAAHRFTCLDKSLSLKIWCLKNKDINFAGSGTSGITEATIQQSEVVNSFTSFKW